MCVPVPFPHRPKSTTTAAKQAVLKMEVAVLKKLQMCPYACKYVHCGHFDDHNYLVMELLGENLSELRRKMRGGRFSLPTTVRLGVQMIRAVQAIHELGYLHRDIKPSNFAMGLQPGRKEQCVMIDFGLTRKYRLPNGQIRPARDIAGFRGTARYASINSHLSKELSRRDDLWSVLYLLIEFLTGQLPWRKLKDKEEIGLLKIHFNSPELVKDLPPPYLTFMLHLQVRSAASINRAAMLFRMFVCRIDAFVYLARLSTMSTGPTMTFSWGF